MRFRFIALLITTILAILLTELAVAQPPEPVPPSYQAPIQSSVTSQGTSRFSWSTSPLPQSEPLWSSLEMLWWPFGKSSRPSSAGETSTSSSTATTTPPSPRAWFSGGTSPSQTPQVTPPSTLPTTPQPPQVIRTTKRVFAVPFQIRPTSPADIPREVELLFSTNRGFSWQSYARLSPDNSYFVFQTDHDGEYWFRIRVIGQDGTAKNLTPQQPPTIVRVESDSLSTAAQPTISSPSTLSTFPTSSVSVPLSISDEPLVVSQHLLPPSRSTFRDADPQNMSFDDMFPVATESSSTVKVVPVHLAKPDMLDTSTSLDIPLLSVLDFLPDLNTPSSTISSSTVLPSTEAAIRLLNTDPLPFVDTIRLDTLRNDTTTDIEAATVPTDSCGKITLVSLEVNVPRPYIVLEWETGGTAWNRAKVSVFRGETAGGPWTSIAEHLDNTGKHSWYIQQEDKVPFHLYIELLTSDGNMVGDMTTRPIQIP